MPETARLNVDIDKAFFKQLKVAATEHELTLRAITESALRHYYEEVMDNGRRNPNS